MALKLMYITNNPEIAQIAEGAGVDRVFVDLEYIGKSERQGGMNTVQSHHTISDVAAIKKAIIKAQLLVRCNPIHQSTENYSSSEQEIDSIIKNGADIIMLPYFKTAEEVAEFIKLVGGRARTMLLIETPEAVANIDAILNIKGIDEVFIGLNDLSLGYGKTFMFELLKDGTVERLCNKFKAKDLSFGFGGIASIGHGMLPSEMIIKEHYRLGSTCTILSRSFCNVNQIERMSVIRSTFVNGIREIREFERQCQSYIDYFLNNQKEIVKVIDNILKSKQ